MPRMFYLFAALLMLSACGGTSSSALVNAPTRVPTAPPTATLAPTVEALRYVFPVKATRYDVSTSHH